MSSKIQLIQNPALQLCKSIYRGRLNAEDYIDLGLPSGTKWAAANLDVTTESKLAETPFQYKCSFFSWGNIEGHDPIDDANFDYDFGNINETAPWYEGQIYENTPGALLTTDIPFNEEYDPATLMLGAPWRTPSSRDFDELFNNCVFIDAEENEIPASSVDKRATVNNIVGLYLKSKINNNKIFFPASGYGHQTKWSAAAERGYYWSGTFVSERNARGMRFNASQTDPAHQESRFSGQTIRPVMK